MGKTLQKLVHRIVPSWLSKTQSPAARPLSPRYLLPWLGDVSSNTTSGKTPSASAMAEDMPELADRSARRHLSSTQSSPSSPETKPGVQNDASSNPQEEIHHHSEEIKHQKLQDLLLQDGMCPQWQEDDQSSNPAAETADLGSPQWQEDDQSSDPAAETSDLGSPQRQEDDQSSNPAAEPADLGSPTSSSSQTALGLKRKTQSLHSDGDEDEEGGGTVANWWAGKRRKGEAGLTSCELPESICSIVGNGRAVVKMTINPQISLWESMVEMIVGNGLWEIGSLDFLLLCYLSLNEPHLHPIIHSSFLQVLEDLHRIQ